jgi:hypothetical protein
LLTACGTPVPSELIQCGGEYADRGGRLTGSGPFPRLQSNDFGPVECRQMGVGFGGSAALKAFADGRTPRYTVPDLRTGEFFQLRAYRLKGSGGQLHLSIRKEGRLRYNLIQAAVQPHNERADFLAMEFTVPAELAGGVLEVRLEVAPGDSTALFEDLSVQVMPRNPTPSNARRSFWQDPRDGRRYGLVHLAQRWWLTEDLASPGDSGYTFEEAIRQMPPDLRIPYLDDWESLNALAGTLPCRSRYLPFMDCLLQPRLRAGGATGLNILPTQAMGEDSLAVEYLTASEHEGGYIGVTFGSSIAAVYRPRSYNQRMQVRAIWDPHPK